MKWGFSLLSIRKEETQAPVDNSRVREMWMSQQASRNHGHSSVDIFGEIWNRLLMWNSSIKSKTETRLCVEHFQALWDSFCGLVCWCFQPHYAKKSSQVALRKPPSMQETQEMWVQSLGWEDPLKKEMATCSNIPAWEIPWTEEPGGPPVGKPPLLPPHPRLSQGFLLSAHQTLASAHTPICHFLFRVYLSF